MCFAGFLCPSEGPVETGKVQRRINTHFALIFGSFHQIIESTMRFLLLPLLLAAALEASVAAQSHLRSLKTCPKDAEYISSDPKECEEIDLTTVVCEKEGWILFFDDRCGCGCDPPMSEPSDPSPECPEEVEYISQDPEKCAEIDPSTLECRNKNLVPYFDEVCGCGCERPPKVDCPKDVDYISRNPRKCEEEVKVECEEKGGSYFFIEDCGCGCDLSDSDCPEDIDYISLDPLECRGLSVIDECEKKKRMPFFDEVCGCGCKKIDCPKDADYKSRNPKKCEEFDPSTFECEKEGWVPFSNEACGCGCQSPCSMPSGVVGPCEALLQRFTFNPDTEVCEEFFYGGCDGNDNRFETQEACERTCGVCPSQSDEDLHYYSKKPEKCMDMGMDKFDKLKEKCEKNGWEVFSGHCGCGCKAP